MLEAFQFRLYPTQDQKVLLEKHFGCVRYIYNWGLEIKNKSYTESKTSLNYAKMCELLTRHKNTEEFKWLNEINSQSLQASLKDLDSAYSRFFKKISGFPKFKSKHKSKNSYHCSQGVKINEKDSLIQLPKIKEIKTVFHRKLPEGKIKTCTISKNKINQYFISILVETNFNLPKKTIPNINKSIGLDLGLTNFITLSNGSKIDNPKYLKKSLKKLRRLSRQYSRSQKGSKNKEKKRIKLAKCHNKVSNQRKDFQHKLSHKLISENQTICVEDLNIKGMIKNKKLARSISDASWCQFITFLDYKADRKGINIIKIGRFMPSSKMCSCGLINNKLKLSDRIWACSCGLKHDRDILAAQNIKKFAFCKSPNSTL